jgi:hypothetical protein
MLGSEPGRLALEEGFDVDCPVETSINPCPVDTRSASQEVAPAVAGKERVGTEVSRCGVPTAPAVEHV